MEKLQTGIAECSVCSDNSECTAEAGDFCVKNPPGSPTGFCYSCSLPKAMEASEGCGLTMPEDDNDKDDKDEKREAKPTPEEDPVCVETAWLQRNGLSHGVFENFGNARVLCVSEDLPCGTPGHILRACNESGCMLKTYADVCSNNPECVETVKPVARLRHSFDWSVIRSSKCSKFGNLQLTSLSQAENAGRYSSSRFIAHVADGLIRSGLGFVCDSIVAFGGAIKKFHKISILRNAGHTFKF